jgi:hypothetical protein
MAEPGPVRPATGAQGERSPSPVAPLSDTPFLAAGLWAGWVGAPRRKATIENAGLSVTRPTLLGGEKSVRPAIVFNAPAEPPDRTIARRRRSPGDSAARDGDGGLLRATADFFRSLPQWRHGCSCKPGRRADEALRWGLRRADAHGGRGNRLYRFGLWLPVRLSSLNLGAAAAP